MVNIRLYRSILIWICLIDLISTIILIQNGYCYEVNPILRWGLSNYGIVGLSIIKILGNILCIIILDWASKKLGTVIYYKIIIISYLIVYFSGALIWIGMNNL